MIVRNSRDQSVRNEPNTEELRRRILEIVNRKFTLTDMELWRETAPEYLPWKPMLQEIQTLDKSKKLRLEIAGPGHWIIHSVKARPAAAKSAAKPPAKSRSKKSPKRTAQAK